MRESIIKLHDIRENENNPRCITEDNLQKLINSLLVFPKMLEIRPIVLNEENLILGGNMRFKALSRIFDMPNEEVTTFIDKQAQRRNLSEIDLGLLKNFWTTWKTDPKIKVLIGELGKDETEQFIIKDNVSAGDWDMDALENFDESDLEDWGVSTWGSIDDYMDYGNECAEVVHEERQRIVLMYARDRKTDVEELLGRELNKPNFRLEELVCAE